MLGELPTFPAAVGNRLLPARVPPLTGSGSVELTMSAGSGTTASAHLSAVVAAPPPPAKPAAAVPAKKRRDYDGLTDEMWQETED